MFGHSKEIKDLYTAYSEKVQLQEDKKDKKEKGIGLEGSINVPGLGKTIETRKDEKNIKDIKNKLTDKDKEDEKKEDELDLVIKNNKKKKDNNENDVDLDGNPITPNNRGKSIPVTRDGKVKPGFKKSGDTFLSLSGSKEDDKKDDKKDAGKEAGKLAGEILAKKQKEDSDDEKGANEWGPGGQPSASKQIDAYKKGRPSPASFKTNQRQTRELIKKQSKEVYPSVTKQDLNQFNRTKKYSADDGSQVERSTVFTKHYKTGKPLGVMTGSQRKAYDKAAAAHKAGTTTTPKPVETKIDTSFKSNKEKDTFKRRDQKLLDKGLKPPKYEKDSPTYTTKIGAFLNNKKKGDLKGTTKHTITKIDHNNEEYDAYDLVLDYIMESKQASSIEEANYIMFEMDQNTIHEIVQAQKKSLDEGLKTAIGIGLLATPYLMKKFGKKPVDKMIKDKRKTSTIGGENRKDKIEKATGVDLDNW